MAEFVQTMKDWRRMCNTFKSCDDCPMQKEDEWTYILCSEGGISSSRPEVAEKIIEKWAAEHPEPVCPTWFEWLETQGVMGSTKETGHFVKDKIFKPIPAEIWEKLGIQPKEG